MRTTSARCAPTARAMPSSWRRSAASITKIRKISRMPAAMENWAKSRKALARPAPDSSAESRASWLTAVASRPADVRDALDCLDHGWTPWAAASSTSPGVGDHDGGDAAGLSRPGGHRAVRRGHGHVPAGSMPLTQRALTVTCVGSGPKKTRRRVAGGGLQPVGGLGGQQHLVLAQVGEGEGLPGLVQPARRMPAAAPGRGPRCPRRARSGRSARSRPGPSP